MTAFALQHFISSQNCLSELCHERYQDKICEEGRGDESFFHFLKKRFQYHQMKIGAMRSESDEKKIGEGDEEQRKEDECDINWIFSFVIVIVIVIFVMDIFAVTVNELMNVLANSLKRIIK